jgi:hypothetical protein
MSDNSQNSTGMIGHNLEQAGCEKYHHSEDRTLVPIFLFTHGIGVSRVGWLDNGQFVKFPGDVPWEQLCEPPFLVTPAT